MKIYIFVFIGGILSLALGSIVGLGLYILGMGWLYHYLLKRGLLFIQSYLYLKTLWQTNNTNFANDTANDLSTLESRHFISEAMHYAENVTGGLQLPVIEQAKTLGYKSRKWGS